VAFLVVAGAYNPSSADSPLTSTPFWQAYSDNPYVAVAHTNGLNRYVMGFLLDAESPLAEKLAVVNAMGWGKETASRMRQLLPEFGLAADALAPNRAPEKVLAQADELDATYSRDFIICYYYALALDLYIDPIRLELPATVINHYTGRYPKSYGIELVHVLIQGNLLIHNMNRWCDIFTKWDSLQASSLHKKDRPNVGAIRIVDEYLAGYGEYCQ